MRSPTRRSARPWTTAALLLLAVLPALLVPTGAASAAPGPAELRRRIAAVDAEIGRVQARVTARAETSAHATWLLFKANRVLEIARIERRDARLWDVAPDQMRRSRLVPSPEEQAVADARARYRTLQDRPGVGGAVAVSERLQARVVELELARARLSELLAGADRPAAAGWGGGTPDAGEWADAFLAEIGAPTCDENRIVVVAWQAQESTEARFNPLATTHAMPGATDFNSVGVKDYRSVAQGLDAARETLELGSPTYGYDAVLASLRACNAAEATAWFVNASAWCRGCTGGAYLTGLLPTVRADFETYAAR
jgi:hypothetical protein